MPMSDNMKQRIVQEVPNVTTIDARKNRVPSRIGPDHQVGGAVGDARTVNWQRIAVKDCAVTGRLPRKFP